MVPNSIRVSTEKGNITMSEELLQETAAEETALNSTEETTMADLEEHFDDANPWNLVTSYMEKGTVLPVKVEGIVNGGAIAMVEGLRGFIPASRLSLSYIEDLETYLLKDIEVKVIDVDQANNRLVLSAREVLKEKEKKAMQEKIANVKIGSGRESSELRRFHPPGRRSVRIGTCVPDQPETRKSSKRRPERRRRS